MSGCIKLFDMEKPNKKETVKASTDKMESEINITATVVFGMPTKNCSYTGICKIEPEENYLEKNGKCQSIAVITQLENNQFLFQFKKEKLKTKTIEQHFGSGYFIVIENFEVPEIIFQAFEQHSLMIPQGIYKVEERESCYEVVFHTI